MHVNELAGSRALDSWWCGRITYYYFFVISHGVNDVCDVEHQHSRNRNNIHHGTSNCALMSWCTVITLVTCFQTKPCQCFWTQVTPSMDPVWTQYQQAILPVCGHKWCQYNLAVDSRTSWWPATMLFSTYSPTQIAHCATSYKTIIIDVSGTSRESLCILFSAKVHNAWVAAALHSL